MEQRRTLYRSRTDSVIGGVSGGLGKYFDTDPLIFRALFVVFTFLAAGGVAAYIIFWIVMPAEPWSYNTRNSNIKNPSDMENDQQNFNNPDDYRNRQYRGRPKNDGSLIAGVILIAIGGLFLIERFVPRINYSDLWPFMLIVIGVIIIVTQYKPKVRD